ncbi:MAG TPA: malectin [Planctomycetota bacterium]|nr:malectin [Planctomycetota bacterium]
MYRLGPFVTGLGVLALAVATASGTPIYAINSGGGAYTAVDGTLFQADAYSTGGKTYTTSDSIANTLDDTLYQSERYQSYSYILPVANDPWGYIVTLKFAEVFQTAPGARVFHVDIEGTRALSNLDIYATAGHDVALDFSFGPIYVTDGNLNIDLITVVDNAKLSALVVEVVPEPASLTLLVLGGLGLLARRRRK